jgi:hypothetical protein
MPFWARRYLYPIFIQVLAKHAKHPNFAAPKPKDLNAHLVFIVIHYAGTEDGRLCVLCDSVGRVQAPCLTM